MGRKEIYEERDLVILLAEIDVKYGDLTIDILKQAHREAPDRFPSYKTFERRLGGIKKIRYMKEFFKE